MLDVTGIPVDFEGDVAAGAIDNAKADVPEIANAKTVIYDRKLTGDYARTARDGTVYVGPNAFRSTEWLDSTLLHESIHVSQIPTRWYANDPLGSSINDVEAYRAEQQNFVRFGLSPADQAEVNQSLLSDMFVIRRLGGPAAVQQVYSGNYTMP